jgi:uncharacterized protein (TIGR02466 family)
MIILKNGTVMTNTSVIFRADLFTRSNIGTLDQRQQLFDQIKVEQQTSKNISNSNIGCWRSNKQFVDIQWLIDETISLYKEADTVYKSANGGTDVFNIQGKTTLTYWTNVNQPGSRNVMHSHSSAHFSCVYYLQGEGTGDLRIINPSNILGNCNYAAPFVRDFYYTPKDGDLILWPAWVPHEVEPNLSSKERINVVFDIGSIIV